MKSKSKVPAIFFGIGGFYLLGGIFIVLFQDVTIIPFISWIRGLSSDEVVWYLSLWAKISILIGAATIATTAFLYRLKVVKG